MDKKQLDFNAPFLSVRRLSTASVDSDGKDSEKLRLNRRQSLPLNKSAWELEEVTKPAAVPFQWEHIPGKAKDEKSSTPHTPKEPSNSPRIPPGMLLDTVQHILEEDLARLNGFSPRIRASPFNEGMNAGEDFNLESEEDAYSDALASLSPPQSFSWKCSDSGLSGIDDLDRKSSRTFCTDPQTRDYMMSRFLPAAKAMILETPQYVSKKPTPVTEPPKYVKKVYSGELRPLLEQYRSNSISPYDQHRQDAENEDETDGTKKKSGKAFGFFPRLCIKKSLCLFNPVPGSKAKAQIQTPTSSSGEIRRLARTSYSGPITPTFEKHTSDAVYRKRPVFRSREFHGIENNLTGKSNQFHHSSETLMTDGPSANRGSLGGRISPYRNETPLSPFHDGARFLGVPKVVENVESKKYSSIDEKGNFSFHQIDDQGSSWVNPVVAEKTLYIDSMTKVETPRNLVSSNAAGPLKPLGNTLVESKVRESSIKNVKCTNTLKGGTMPRPKAFGSFDVVPPSDHGTNHKGQGYRNQGLEVDRNLEHEVRSLECSKADSIRKLDNTVKENDQGGIIVAGTFLSPLAPPLPKSPSESWLWRTVSLRNPFPKKQVQKTSTTDAKWEIIVKASNVHHDHVRYSEELLPHVSQHSKS